jgi:hypothetical protein
VPFVQSANGWIQLPETLENCAPAPPEFAAAAYPDQLALTACCASVVAADAEGAAPMTIAPAIASKEMIRGVFTFVIL